jgi:hypothetical protein
LQPPSLPVDSLFMARAPSSVSKPSLSARPHVDQIRLVVAQSDHRPSNPISGRIAPGTLQLGSHPCPWDNTQIQQATTLDAAARRRDVDDQSPPDRSTATTTAAPALERPRRPRSAGRSDSTRQPAPVRAPANPPRSADDPESSQDSDRDPGIQSSCHQLSVHRIRLVFDMHNARRGAGFERRKGHSLPRGISPSGVGIGSP